METAASRECAGRGGSGTREEATGLARRAAGRRVSLGGITPFPGVRAITGCDASTGGGWSMGWADTTAMAGAWGITAWEDGSPAGGSTGPISTGANSGMTAGSCSITG